MSKGKTQSLLCAFAPLRENFFGLALILCMSLLCMSCQKAASQPVLTIESEITPQPPRVGATSIKLRVADASGQPLSGLRIRLEGNMSHAGMRPVISEANESGPGRYQAQLEFTMAGDWVVLIELTLPDGSRLERQLEVKAVRAS